MSFLKITASLFCLGCLFFSQNNKITGECKAGTSSENSQVSISIDKNGLFYIMPGNRSQVFVFIIRSLGTPHGECDLNPRVSKTPVGMMRFFALISFFDILLISPET